MTTDVLEKPEGDSKDPESTKSAEKTRLLFCGDLHGDIERAKELIQIAKEHKCSEIVQAGDWGYIWPRDDSHKNLSNILTSYDMSMRFCDGNHDTHPVLRKFSRDTDNNVAPGLTYQFRGSKKTVGSVTMVFLGGAPSIDRAWRTTGISWWPEEEITEQDVEEALKHKGEHIDVLVTHDAAIAPPGIKDGGSASFSYRAAQSTAFIMKVIEELKPKLHIHGHYHYRYQGLIKGTVVKGLASNIDSLLDNYLIYEK